MSVDGELVQQSHLSFHLYYIFGRHWWRLAWKRDL